MKELLSRKLSSRIKRGFLAGFIVGTAGAALLVAGAIQYLNPEIPDVAALRDVRLQVPLRIYTRDGKLLAQVGEQRRIPLAFESYPVTVVNAFLAAEDDRFFAHNGVDYEGLARALLVNLATGSKREGGGTITMQLARNMFLSPERSYRRKMLEIISAWRIEHSFSKQEILALYLNKIFLGQRAYGVGAAAEVYFGKSVAELTLPEVAMLAGLPRAPSRENPIASPELAKTRRSYVLRRMYELKFISADDREAAEQAPIAAELHGFGVDVDAPYVAEMARLELEKRYGPRIYTDNFAVYTTIDSRLQQAAVHALRVAVLEYDSRHGYRGVAGKIDPAVVKDGGSVAAALAKYPSVGGLTPAIVAKLGNSDAQLQTRSGPATISLENMRWARTPSTNSEGEEVLGPAPSKPSDVLKVGDVVYIGQLASGAWRLLQVPSAQAAIAALDPTDGAVVALEGGFDFTASHFNRAVQAQRQPGSSIKPYLYSSALENGYTPASIVNDSPMVVDDGNAEGNWRPQNTNRQFMGPMRLREALVRSRNLVSIRLISSLGTDYVTDYLKRFGFSDQQVPHNLSLALGATQVSPLDQARGYAVFANGGMLVEPYLIERVIGAEGELIYAADPQRVCGSCDAGADFQLQETAGATTRVPVPDEEASANGAGETVEHGTPARATLRALPLAYKAAPRVINATNAFLMTDIMKEVIRRGTATRALVLNRRDIAGKTGTSNDLRDAWFVGFNADLVAAAWIGFDQERPLGAGEEGGRTALPIWIYFMQQALRGVPEHSMRQPEGIVSMRISTESGKPTTRTGPGTMFEYFDKAHLPDVELESESGASESSPASESLF